MSDDILNAKELSAPRQALQELETFFEKSPAFVAVLRGPTFIFEKVNARYYELVGHRDTIGKTLLEVLPEMEGQGYLELLTKVYQTGEPFSGSELPAYLQPVPGGPREPRFIDLVYQRIDGDPHCIFAHGIDVTESVLSRRAVENERENFRNLFEQTPEMVVILSGPDHVFEFVNEAHIKAIGFDATGRTVREAQPDSVEGHKILDEVYRTGVTSNLIEIPVTMSGRQRFFNVTHSARRSEAGKIIGVMALGTEVTDQVLARRALEASQSRFRELAESLPTIVFIAGTNGRTTYYNRRWYTYTGMPTDVDFTWGWKNTIHPEDQELSFKKWVESMKFGVPYEREERIKAADGQYRWHLARATPVRDAAGNITEWFGTLTDIHQQMDAGREFVDTLESMSDAFCSVDRNWIITRVNDHMEKVTGTKRSVLVGKHYLQHFYPEGGPVVASYLKSMEERETVNFENYYGPLEIWTENRVYPKSDGGIALFFTDVTERKATEAKLRLERHRLETLFQDSPAAMALWTGPDFVFEKVNPEYQAIFPGRQLLGKPFLEALPELVGQPFFGLLTEVLNTGMPYVGKEVLATLRRKIGGVLEDRYYDFTFMRVNDEAGNAFGVYVHAIDVTDRVMDRRKLLESEAKITLALREAEGAKVEAERANDLKTAFLANMSHEIRTPLGAMIGFADLMKDESISEDQRAGYVDVLVRNGHQLSHIINDILDISKVESGHLTIEYLPTDIVKVASDVIALLNVTANEKEISLELNVEAPLPREVRTDAVRLRQILTNVVGNAVKFTKRGKVTVRIFSPAADAEFPTVAFEVTDSGMGIAPQDVSKLFQVFSQADGSITRKFGGTGLGLALSKRLAQALGGDVVLEQTEPTRGSTFLVTIQSRHQTEAALPAENKPVLPDSRPPEDLRGLNVLLVEDSPDNQRLIGLVLSRYGVTIDIAENGLQGLEKALRGRYDVVLMDIQMPLMDGYTATQKLRESGYDKPIIALTAHAMNEVRIKCLNVGCTDHLTKPISINELIRTVVRYAPTVH